MSPADLQRLFGSYPDVVLLGLAGTIVVMALHQVAVRTVARRATTTRWSWLQRLVYGGFVGSALALGGTAFFAVFTRGHLLSWPLLLHVVAAGPFVVLLAMLALVFGRAAAPRSDGRVMGPLGKAAFAVALLAAIVTAGSMLASMFPLFGAVDMERLLDVHRLAGLTLVCVLMLHGYLVVTARREAAPSGDGDASPST